MLHEGCYKIILTVFEKLKIDSGPKKFTEYMNDERSMDHKILTQFSGSYLIVNLFFPKRPQFIF